MIPQWLARLREVLWSEAEALGRFQRELREAGRYFYALGRDLLDGQVSMRAMSLVYTTLLSLVPLLALAFSLLKAFGAHNSLAPVLQELFAPLGPQGATLATNVVGFVENIKVGVLGSVGVVLLIYTVLSMIQKVEDAFNFIWRVGARRRLGQRISEYLSVLVVGPLVVAMALAATATVMSSGLVASIAKIEPFGLALYIGGRLVPYFLIVALFTFLYGFIPNTRVRFRAAFGGGLLAGVLWQSASLGFASFVANSPNYNAIYSGFAIVILALIWIYVGWLILLVGCQLAYYLQFPERLTPTRVAPHLWGRAAELLGLQAMAMVGRRFIHGEAPLTVDELRRDLAALPEHVERVVGVLVHHGVLAETGVDGRTLLPRRDLDSLTMAQLWQLLREGESRGSGAGGEAHAFIDQAEQAFAGGAGAKTVRDWLAETQPRG